MPRSRKRSDSPIRVAALASLPCEVCGRLFRTFADKKQHVLDCECTYCRKCDKELRTRAQVLLHWSLHDKSSRRAIIKLQPFPFQEG